ncbi:MAG TPA: two-component regulator propeller domain-containing protein [Puia sp.]
MSNDKVNCILQDQRGFLWFGTEDGLNRYDGKYFVVFKYKPNDTSGISGNKITDLYEDKSGILWIATADGGFTKYDYHLPALQQFRQFKHHADNPGSLPENGIYKITEDRWGNLWMAASGSCVIRFNKKREKFDIPVRGATPGVLPLLMDDKDTLRIGKTGGGEIKINTGTLQYTEDVCYSDTHAKSPPASITVLFKDSGHDLWFSAANRQVYHFSANGQEENIFRYTNVTPNMPSDEIVSFAEDHQMQIWMAGKNTGVTLYNKLTHKLCNYRSASLKKGTLASDHANVVYVDRQGIVWIGTNNGLSVLNPLFSPFVQHFLPATGKNINVYDFYKDARGKLWIATSDGIFIQSPGIPGFGHRKIIYQGQELAATKFFIDEDGTFYLGTDYTLFVYDSKSNRIALLPNTTADPVMKRLINSRIVSIVRDTIDKHPVILVSPYGHYFTYYDLVEKKWISKIDSVKNNIIEQFNIGDNQIRKLYKDDWGSLWLATNKLGLGSWNRQNAGPIQYHCYDLRNNSSISNNDVYDIQEDNKGNFWVSTYGGGLNYYNKSAGKFTHITESANLTEGLQSDRTGNIWMICNGHLHKYDPVSRTYSCYDLPDLRVSDGIRGYVYKDNQNNMYAGGENYYITFNPENVTRINNEPNTYFTDFKIFNSSYGDLLEKKSIELDHSQNYFSIEYSAPDFSGDNIEYAYMLEGEDKDWVTAGKRNFVSYSNLPAGNYLFKVGASNWKGSHFTKFTSIAIHICPPFWLSWWFYVMVMVMLSSFGYLFYRFRINELLMRQSIRNGIAQDLHDQIGSTLSSISVYSEVAKLYQQQHKADQLKNLLHTIGETAIETINEMDDLVWAINPKNDNLGSIIQRIESFAQPLCVAKNINLTINADFKLLSVTPAMPIRKNTFLILKELINNAIKHAECKNITLSILLFYNVLELHLTDDGIGFDLTRADVEQSESLSGNGLPNMRRRAEELKADMMIQSEKDKGTTFRIKFVI